MEKSLSKQRFSPLAVALLSLACACRGEDAGGAVLPGSSVDVEVSGDARNDAPEPRSDVSTEGSVMMETSDGASPVATDRSAEVAPMPDASADGPHGPGPNGVLQYHNNLARDGLYTDPAFTKDAAAHLHMDTTFRAPIQGPTYSQPLYFDAGPGGKDIVFAVTELNLVYAFDAATGSQIWQRKLGEPVASSSLPCGGINPLGITGTPVIDAPSRKIFVAAMTTPDGGTTKAHLVFSLSVDDGAITAGWPLDVSASFQNAAVPFDSSVQNQRGALALVNGVLYVPYGGHGGDCGRYHGWVVAVPTANPSSVTAFATRSFKGGIWGPSGVASDGTSIFVTTGNTVPEATWGHGEAVLRLQPDATFGEQTSDYFAPSNWRDLDVADLDVGGTGPVLLEVPGATPSKLVVAFGKNGVAYVADRTNLGGIGQGNGTTGEGIVSAQISSTEIITAAAAYRTPEAAYVVTIGNGIGCPGPVGDLTALKISATAPPQISVAWCGYQASNASPMVTTPDGQSDFVVWGIGTGSTNRLVGFDGDTGQVVFAGGGPDDAMSYVRGRATAIAAKGRIFVAADAAVFAFTTR